MRPALIVLVLALAACGGSSKPDPVIQRIEATSDCSRLQGEFTWAEARAEAGYMEAADARMESLGCYGTNRG